MGGKKKHHGFKKFKKGFKKGVKKVGKAAGKEALRAGKGYIKEQVPGSAEAMKATRKAMKRGGRSSQEPTRRERESERAPSTPRSSDNEEGERRRRRESRKEEAESEAPARYREQRKQPEEREYERAPPRSATPRRGSRERGRARSRPPTKERRKPREGGGRGRKKGSKQRGRARAMDGAFGDNMDSWQYGGIQGLPDNVVQPQSAIRLARYGAFGDYMSNYDDYNGEYQQYEDFNDYGGFFTANDDYYEELGEYYDGYGYGVMPVVVPGHPKAAVTAHNSPQASFAVYDDDEYDDGLDYYYTLRRNGGYGNRYGRRRLMEFGANEGFIEESSSWILAGVFGVGFMVLFCIIAAFIYRWYKKRECKTVKMSDIKVVAVMSDEERGGSSNELYAIKINDS